MYKMVLLVRLYKTSPHRISFFVYVCDLNSATVGPQTIAIYSEEQKFASP